MIQLEAKLAASIDAAFYFVETADRLIEEAIRRAPHRAPQLWDAMRLIKPTAQFVALRPEVWSSHATELIRRIEYGESTEPPTDAEMLMFFVDAAKVQVHTGNHAVLHLTLTRRVLGDTVFRERFPDFDALGIRESPRGACAELEARYREAMTGKLNRYKPREERWHRLSDERKAQIFGKTRA